MINYTYLALLFCGLLLGCSSKSKLQPSVENQSLNGLLSQGERNALRDQYEQKITLLNKKIDSLEKLLPGQGIAQQRPPTAYATIHPEDTNDITQLFIQARIQNQALKDTLNQLRKELHERYFLPGHRARTVFFKKSSYHCYIVDTRQSSLQLYWQDNKNRPFFSLKKLSSYLNQQGKTLVFATNAGMYRPNRIPQGLFIENRRTKIPIDRKTTGYGNFYLQPNGILLIDTSRHAKVITTQQYTDSLAVQAEYATQSGPMVVINGEINEIFNPSSENVHFRSGVGQIDKHTIVFIISNQRVNFHEFASVFKEVFQCENALYLDGAISQMYLPELGRFQDGGEFGAIIGITKN